MKGKDMHGIRQTRAKATILTILACALCAYMTIALPARLPAEPYDFAAGAAIDIEAARMAYGSSRESSELYALLLGLCRETSISGEVSNEIADLGNELYARARVGEVDLETIGDPEDTTAMFALLSQMGVTPYGH